MEYLERFNLYVPLYFWLGALFSRSCFFSSADFRPPLCARTGLIGMIAIATLSHTIQRIQGHWRRRHAGYRSEAKRLPRVKTHGSGDQPTVRHMSFRFCWYWLSSFWRKYSIKHSGVGPFL